MSLPRYSEYKDTGIASLGSVPVHWRVTRLKQMATIQNGRDYKDVETETAGYPVFGSGGEFARATDYLYNGESVLLGRKGTIDRPLYINGPFWTADTMFYTVVNKNTSAKYLYYCALTIPFDLYSTNTALPSMTQADLGGIHFAAPCLAEQETIVTFLDREASKIDALISEQDKLIALLAETRLATISHAVTKGLNPSASLKKSGVRWMGDVRNDWQVGSIQSFARRESGHTPSRQHPEYWENCTIPWFTLADVWQIRSGSVKYVHKTKELVSELGIKNSSARLLPAGTVVLSRTASVGYSAIMGVEMATTQDFVNWVCHAVLNPEFLLYVLRCMRPEFDRLMMGSTHQTIYMPDITKLRMALPPIEEQSEIIAFLDKKTAAFDALSEAAIRGISLLKERRGALISAAVTGKIDVRKVVQLEQTTMQKAA